MKRAEYFNFIEFKLTHLATRIETRGKLNVLDINLHSENFYAHFLQTLFGWKLQNLNAVHQNAAGVDLIDTTNSILVQISATATKQKIESALAKDLSAYKGYSFKFISISKNAQPLRTKTFSNPHGLIFSPSTDIHDIPSILKVISGMNIDQQEQVHDFLKKELRSECSPEKVESNLATIIKILAKENWTQGAISLETIPYDIETKITHNQLDTARIFIDDYKIHYPRIDKIYSEFDREGANKSLSILNSIRSEYMTLNLTDSPDQCFFSIIEKITRKIQESDNYAPLPDEELDLCVQILVVDAFIRCKIFKNPMENTNACS